MTYSVLKVPLNPNQPTFRVVPIYWQGGGSVPLISERKGTDPHWKHLR